MIKLLIAMPFHAGDAVLAERLMDWCFQLNDKQKIPATILLCGSLDCHAELKTKVKIAAEVAFDSVIELDMTALPAQNNAQGKGALIGRSLLRIATFVGKSARWPYLLLEPDCVPLNKEWLNKIADAYDKQPRRYLGNYMRMTTPQGDKRFVSRVAVYPFGALNDLNANNDTLPACTKTRLIQHLPFNGLEDMDKFWPEAVLIHADKTGALIEHLRGGSSNMVEVTDAIVDESDEPVLTQSQLDKAAKDLRESELKGGMTAPVAALPPATAPVVQAPAPAAVAQIETEDADDKQPPVPQIVRPAVQPRQTMVKAPSKSNGR